MSSVRTILAGLFTALGGFFLLALTAGAGFAIYLATASDNIAPAADAEAVSTRPLMRAETTSTPRQKVAWLASTALGRPLNAPAPAPNSKARIRQLQQALSRAGCYDGPISGVWSGTSKDAMRHFVRTANAELPVDRPDDALLALVESNETVKCTTDDTASTGTLAVGASLQAASYSDGTPAAIRSDSHPPKEEPAMLDREWAPSGMLVSPKESPAIVHAPMTTGSPAAPVDMTASGDPAPGPQSALPAVSAAHFEGDKPLPAARQIDPPPVTASEGSAAPHAKSKKSRTAKRRRARYDDVETTISKSFNSLQRSLASMF